jgi:hypothetical protein
MAHKDSDCAMTAKDVAALFAEPIWAAKYPPILTAQQAADLAQVPLATLYAWSSQGLLRSCAQRAGKHLRIIRDAFVRKLFSDEGLHGD